MSPASLGAWGKRGIQARIMLLVGVGTLTALTTLGWRAWVHVRALSAEILTERALIARCTATRVEWFLRTELEALQGVAAGLVLTPDSADSDEAAAAVRGAFQRARLVRRIWLTDLTGAPRWSHPREPQDMRAFGHLPEFAAARDAGRPSITGLLRQSAGPSALAFLPARDLDGRVVSVVAGELDLSRGRTEPLIGDCRLGETGSFDLTDSRGLVIASTDSSRALALAAHADEIEAAARRRQPAVLTVGPPGSRDIVAIAPVGGTPWAVLVRQHESEALREQHALRVTLLGLSPALLGITLLFAWGAQHSVRRSLVVLSRAASRIALGDLSEPIPPLPRDEIGAVGVSLDRMRSALKSSLDDTERANRQLEARVAERTRELAAANRRLRERDETRADLLRKVITAQEDERKRIARELHDETSQTLSALAITLETAAAGGPDAARPRLAEAKALTLRALEELRRLMLDLRPSVLDDLGLLSAIRWSVERHLEPRGIAVRCEFGSDDLGERLPAEVETALFRVVQEAIINIARHSGATSALIQVDESHGSLVIEVEDDGEGFDPAGLPPPGPKRRGLGLLGMRERVELLGGRLEIDTAPGRGTRLAVTVPLSPETSHE